MLQRRKSAAYLRPLSHTVFSLFCHLFEIIEVVGGWGIRWVQVSQKAFSPCCCLLQLSIFNLSCMLPIGLSATRSSLIGRSARCAIQALFSSLSSNTVLQCSEDCSSPVLETFYKSNPSFPFKPRWHRQAGSVSFITHTRSYSSHRQRLEPSPRTFSSPSSYMCMVSILHTHTLTHSLSPSVSPSRWHCTQRTHIYTHTEQWKNKWRASYIMCSSMLICDIDGHTMGSKMESGLLDSTE